MEIPALLLQIHSNNIGAMVEAAASSSKQHHHQQRQYSCSPSLQKALFRATLFLFVLLVHKLQAAPPPAASVFLFPFSTKGPFQGHTFPLCLTS